MMEFEKLLRSLEPESASDMAEELLERLGLAGEVRKQAAFEKAKAGLPNERSAEMKASEAEFMSSEYEANAESQETTETVAAEVTEEAESVESRELNDDYEFLETQISDTAWDDIYPEDTGGEAAEEIMLPYKRMRRIWEFDSGQSSMESGEAFREGLGTQAESGLSAREFSDFFRRDSRRYDRGFQKY